MDRFSNSVVAAKRTVNKKDRGHVDGSPAGSQEGQGARRLQSLLLGPTLAPNPKIPTPNPQPNSKPQILNQVHPSEAIGDLIFPKGGQTQPETGNSKPDTRNSEPET